jgi:ABC-type uncharacterized transport system substrate-binding protein
LGLELYDFGARNVNELDSAFEAIRNSRVGALMVLGDPTLIVHKAEIIEFAAKIRLPAIYSSEAHAVAGAS